MADEPTLGEVSRQVESIRRDNREDHDRLRRSVSHRVDREVYEADQRLWHDRYDQLRRDFDELKEAREEDADRIEKAKADRAANRKWLIASLIIPLGIGLLEIYFAIKGVK